jgi:lipopolysaccharide/colanic/teichoic acid biosynthesis glycosyltransferase
VAGIGLVLSSPVVAVAGLAIWIESRGPAFYASARVGRDGRPFRMYKLRTMVVGADRMGLAVTAGDDRRITRVGRLLRRTKLDELPQLFNVLKGDMSLVGPRPEHPDFVRLYDDRQRRVLTVRPGMTSAASVRFHDEEEQLKGSQVEADYVKRIMPAKLEIDLRYVESAGIGEDLQILGQTVLVVLRKLLPPARGTSAKRG